MRTGPFTKPGRASRSSNSTPRARTLGTYRATPAAARALACSSLCPAAEAVLAVPSWSREAAELWSATHVGSVWLAGLCRSAGLDLGFFGAGSVQSPHSAGQAAETAVPDAPSCAVPDGPSRRASTRSESHPRGRKVSSHVTPFRTAGSQSSQRSAKQDRYSRRPSLWEKGHVVAAASDAATTSMAEGSDFRASTVLPDTAKGR
mmetsp:Transcript_65013/g.169131  ORF Transcript_65013/g.169131 Transcript_65013/m.169131 type:complete len:204 (+) Transcript_65013:546-1157(+)